KYDTDLTDAEWAVFEKTMQDIRKSPRGRNPGVRPNPVHVAFSLGNSAARGPLPEQQRKDKLCNRISGKRNG
ncbi:MAG: hypothetical protein LBJ46_10205, partial [Planctomycetota bacterium]|nr:hypothetical protein [Planctomycetota bacterium]